jgi:hypothetical protein
MMYEKPVLCLIGSTASIVLGSSNNGRSDMFPESNLRKTGEIEDGLDD